MPHREIGDISQSCEVEVINMTPPAQPPHESSTSESLEKFFDRSKNQQQHESAEEQVNFLPQKELQQTMSQRLSNSFRKFLLLIWKNTYVIRKRHWLATLFEIIVPLFLFLLMAVLRASTGAFGVVNYTNATYYSEVPETELLSYENDILSPSVSSVISYAPANDFTSKLVQRLATKCKLRNDAVEGFESESALIDHYNKLILKNPDAEQEIHAIIFEDDAANGRLPEKLKYKLRLNYYPHFATDNLFGSLQAPPYSEHDKYMLSSFSRYQLCLDKSFIELVTANLTGQQPETLKDQIFLQRMPFPPYFADQGYTTVAQQLLPILAVISFLPLCIVVITRVVEEKQTGVRELMRLMGMESWAMWASWLVDALLVRIITLALVVTLLKVEFEPDAGAVFKLTDGSLVYFMLLLYTTAGICSCFLLSTFFSKPSVAMSVGLIFWLTSYSLPSILVSKYALGFNIKRALMLLPNMALYYMLLIILDFEVKDVGAQWWNFLESSTGSSNDLSMADVALMLTISTILCSLLTWYIGCIAPGEFGVARPWHFLFTAAYWSPRSKLVRDAAPEWDTDEDQGKNFERPLSKNFNEPGVGVFIRDLTKTYEGGLGKLPVKAVRGLSLDLYKGEVTALLGHNGAGKTTTMSILTGMIAPSGGAVTVLGHNLATELSTVRTSLGLCPQHNMLFKDLTVREHLIFFAMMKGNSYEAAITEAQELVEQVKLKEKWTQIATHLSGGMQRKLALAVALIGGSKVLMLDEPTSGLDPEARREIWDLLLGMRGQRTILLSTHFMEEADVLGDTIAIMAHGKVHCCGSSIYLKRHYGAGYHLTVLRKPKCDVDSISQLVSKAVPDAEFLRNRNEDQTDSGGPSAAISPITFRLPSNSTHLFAKMLDKLESSRDDLGIANVSMSVTTMEEVFLKVGQLTDIAKAKEEKNGEMDETDCAPINGDNDYADPERNDSSEALTVKNVGWKLLLQQLWALMVKKFLHVIRRWWILIYMTAMSLAIIIATIILSSSIGGLVNKNYPPLPLSLSTYGDSQDLSVLYSASPGAEAAKASQAYMQLANKLARVKKVPPSKGVLHSLLEESVDNELAYKKQYITAASFNETPDASLKATAFFSSTALHANPISLNLLMNSLLAWKTGSSKYHIEAINHPIISHPLREQLNGRAEAPLVAAMIWLLIPPIAWLTVTASAIMLPLQERVCGARQLQVMSGVPYWLIWLSYLLVDVAVCTAIALLSIIAVLIFDTSSTYSGPNEIGVLFLIMFLYSISGTIFAYLISFVKNLPAGAESFFNNLNIMAGFVINIIIYILEVMWSPDNRHGDNALVMRNVFGPLLPYSALTSALSHFAATATYNSQCVNMPEQVKNVLCVQFDPAHFSEQRCCENLCKLLGNCFKPIPYLAWEGDTSSIEPVVKYGPFLREIVFLLLGCFWIVVVIMLDSSLLALAKEKVLAFMQGRHSEDETDSVPMDDDVQEECSRVTQSCNTSSQTEAILTVQNLVKDYGIPIRHSRFHAVRGITFAVKPGECFGLLGVNGAGKTTTFQMLTGGEVPTQGDATLLGRRLSTNRFRYLQDLGYCPQFDAQLDMLSGYETLRLYANLRGMPRYKVNSEINRWFHVLGLTEYGSRLTGTYSGGNRRKLSAAMAMIGEPPLVLLDEPTSGVDPIARRRLWHVLERCQRSGQAIVLTSHSMDECEALCDRLGIMVSGQLRCLGPTAHLKQKFGQGFTVMVKVRTASWTATPEHLKATSLALQKLEEQIKDRLHPCTLRDQHQGLLHYHVTDTKKRWSELFAAMEELKLQHAEIFEDYTISETTLEQVFLSFARNKAMLEDSDEVNPV